MNMHRFPADICRYLTQNTTGIIAVLFVLVLALPQMHGQHHAPPVGAARTLQSGTIAFTEPQSIVLDNRTGIEDRICLSHYEGDSLTALQFRIVNTVGHARFESASLGDSLTASGDWYFSCSIRHGALQPDLGATDTITVVLFALNGAALASGSYSDLVRFRYAVSDIGISMDSTLLQIEQVVGSLRLGGDAALGAGSPKTVIIMNTVQKGDVDGNDEVDINDILGLIHVILGRETLRGDAVSRADIAPWPGGDESVNVRDLVLTQRVILDGAYPDGTPLRFAPEDPGNGHRTAAPTAAPDVKIVIYVHAGGMAIHMTNAVKVKGIQLELNNVPSMPDTLRLRTAFDPGPTWNRTSSNVLVLLMNNDAALPVAPGAQYITFLSFPIQNPFQINLKKLIVADERNGKITSLEASIVYGTPNGLDETPRPSIADIGSLYPNPTASGASISFRVPVRSQLRVSVHTATGELVRVLSDDAFEPGNHTLAWDGRDGTGMRLPAGAYWIALNSGASKSTRILHLLR